MVLIFFIMTVMYRTHVQQHEQSPSSQAAEKQQGGEVKTEEYVNAGGDDSRVGHGTGRPSTGEIRLHGSMEQYTALGHVYGADIFFPSNTKES